MSVHCDRCGGPLAKGSHARCVQARVLEPPRYCRACGRRLRVQVLPDRFHASCHEHGEVPQP